MDIRFIRDAITLSFDFDYRYCFYCGRRLFDEEVVVCNDCAKLLINLCRPARLRTYYDDLSSLFRCEVIFECETCGEVINECKHYKGLRLGNVTGTVFNNIEINNTKSTAIPRKDYFFKVKKEK
jgi:predicted RNA-binding Zn-ribbon protein involved in translation (DUF1610 family)